MTEFTAASPVEPGGTSPGQLLREARERRGMHIAALAAAIKVAPARLEALEADDYSGMPDTTFARALAQAVCRSLKIDPAPVLARMPGSPQARLERVDEGLNAPFRDRPGRLVEAADIAPWRHPVAWLALALLVVAAAFVWWPRQDAAEPEPLPPGAEPLASAPAGLSATPASAVDAVVAPASAPGSAPAAPSVAAAGLPATAGAAATATAAPAQPAAPVPAAAASLPILAAASALPAGTLGSGGQAAAASVPRVAGGDAAVLRAVQDSWIQVTDASGKVLAARTFTAGETVPFTGPLPLRVRIGNVQGTELAFRGKPVDLRALTRDNTVTVTLPLPAATP